MISKNEQCIGLTIFIMLRRLINAYNISLDKKPLTTKSITFAVMNTGGDIISQIYEAKHKCIPLSINWKRAVIMGMFGFSIGAPTHHYWFNQLDKLPQFMYSRYKLKLSLFGEKIMMIIADQIIFAPIYTIVFLTTVSAANYYKQDKAPIQKAFEHTNNAFKPTYLADCIIWPPLQLINFMYIPLQYQVLYVNVCNLGWNTFLSYMVNKNK